MNNIYPENISEHNKSQQLNRCLVKLVEINFNRTIPTFHLLSMMHSIALQQCQRRNSTSCFKPPSLQKKTLRHLPDIFLVITKKSRQQSAIKKTNKADKIVPVDRLCESRSVGRCESTENDRKCFQIHGSFGIVAAIRWFF